MIRPPLVIIAVLLLAACSRMERDAEDVFEHAFKAERPPSGVAVVNGVLWQNRPLLVFYEEAWRLQLKGPDAMSFVRHRWPDLTPGRPAILAISDETPWFPYGGDGYTTWISPSDDALFVIERAASRDVFVAHVPL
jgi:hypothetical protein